MNNPIIVPDTPSEFNQEALIKFRETEEDTPLFAFFISRNFYASLENHKNDMLAETLGRCNGVAGKYFVIQKDLSTAYRELMKKDHLVLMAQFSAEDIQKVIKDNPPGSRL